MPLITERPTGFERNRLPDSSLQCVCLSGGTFLGVHVVGLYFVRVARGTKLTPYMTFQFTDDSYCFEKNATPECKCSILLFCLLSEFFYQIV